MVLISILWIALLFLKKVLWNNVAGPTLVSMGVFHSKMIGILLLFIFLLSHKSTLK